LRNTLFLAAAVAILGLNGAEAADLAARPYLKAPAPAAVYDWTGFYVGGNVGYGWGENTNPSLNLVNPGNIANITTFLTTGFPGFVSGNQYPNLNPNGAFGGLQFGYDKQFGRWVLGAVTDIQGADFKASRLVSTSLAATFANADESLSARINWFGTLRGKAGFAMNDWLLYGTGGLAYGRTTSSIGLSCTPGGLNCFGINFAGNSTETRVGWSAGAGVSKAFGNWNVGVEYLHVDLGRSSVTAVDQTGFAGLATTTITQSQRFAVDTARLTVNYKFGSAPVVAKY
jgi:outer membrane immunogenic protein